MILKSLWHSARLGKAQALLLKGEYAKAQAIFVSIVNGSPKELVLLSAHAGLAATEFNMGKKLNAQHYARLFIQQVEESPKLMSSPEVQKKRDEMRRYIR